MDYKSELVKKYLTDILNIPSPSGYTHNIIEYIKKELDDKSIEYKMTNKGALVATIPGINNEYQKDEKILAESGSR